MTLLPLALYQKSLLPTAVLPVGLQALPYWLTVKGHSQTWPIMKTNMLQCFYDAHTIGDALELFAEVLLLTQNWCRSPLLEVAVQDNDGVRAAPHLWA